MIRRQSDAAGERWSKWGDPGYLATKAWERAEQRRFALTVWVWAVTIGAWLAILAWTLR